MFDHNTLYQNSKVELMKSYQLVNLLRYNTNYYPSKYMKEIIVYRL